MHARNSDIALMTGIFGTFPQQFPIDTDRPYALKDKELGSLTFCCMGGRGDSRVDKKSESFADRIPDYARRAREQYERLRLDAFFDRFVLYTRNEEGDGIIVAIGVDEFYYVLAAWADRKESVWVPEFDDTHKLVLKH